mmetsp:Transcript_278/g.324  ORF Transcript_278/g.324 Transcript_278/m.324 type:complete len:350 (+) Transcript_278:415-1464(+)
MDLTRMVKNDDLSGEVSGTQWRVALGVTSDVSTTDILDGNILDIEANIVSRYSLGERFMMHLNRLDLSGDTTWSESHNHTRLQDTSLNTADWHGTDTRDLVDILQWHAKWLVNWALWRLDGIESLKEGRSLPPWHVRGLLEHVVTVPARNWDERHASWLVANLLDVGGHLSLDLVVAILGVFDRFVIHLVHTHNHLFHTKGVSEESMLTGLSVGADTSFKFTRTRGNDEDSNISLGCTSDHVLDEITMSRSIDDGEMVFTSLELPESNINGDTTLALRLQLVEHPRVLERGLTELGSLLLELLDGTFVNSTALVDQVTSGGRFTSIDMTNDDEVYMCLLLTHSVLRYEI